MVEKYRVKHRENVNMNGKLTNFMLYKKEINGIGQIVYIYVGMFSVWGWNASINRCIASYEKEQKLNDILV